MKKIVYSIVLFCLISIIVSGCTTRDDSVFSKDGLFRVECINAKGSNINNRTQDEYYYYLEPYCDIYCYSYKDKEQELLYKASYAVQDYCISNEYLFYTYDIDGGKKINRVNLKTKNEDCIYENDDIDSIQITTENNYLYIMTDKNDYAYRCKVDGNFKTDLEEADLFFEINDGISTNTEQYVRVGNKNVTIRSNKSAKAKIPYSYQVEGEKEKTINCFDEYECGNSQLFSQYMISDDANTIYGVMCVSNNRKTSIDLYQNDIKKDVFFSLNIDTGDSCILYDTENNKTRIIGYDGKKLYLFKDNYKIYSYSLENSEEQEVMAIPKSNDAIFDWSKQYLIVRYRNDDKEYKIKTLEMIN